MPQEKDQFDYSLPNDLLQLANNLFEAEEVEEIEEEDDMLTWFKDGEFNLEDEKIISKLENAGFEITTEVRERDYSKLPINSPERTLAYVIDQRLPDDTIDQNYYNRITGITAPNSYLIEKGEIDENNLFVDPKNSQGVQEIDRYIKANDLDLAAPNLYFNQDKNNEFIEKYYGIENLKKQGININDFQGYLNKLGVPNDFENRVEEGEFNPLTLPGKYAESRGEKEDSNIAAYTKEQALTNFLKGYQNNQDNKANEYNQLLYMRKNQDKFSKEIYDEETKKLETKRLEEAKLLQSMDIRISNSPNIPSFSKLKPYLEWGLEQAKEEVAGFTLYDTKAKDAYLKEYYPLVYQHEQEVKFKNREFKNTLDNRGTALSIVYDALYFVGAVGEGLLTSVQEGAHFISNAVGYDQSVRQQKARIKIGKDLNDSLDYAYIVGKEAEFTNSQGKTERYIKDSNGGIFNATGGYSIGNEDPDYQAINDALEKSTKTGSSFSGRGFAVQSGNAIGQLGVQVALTYATGGLNRFLSPLLLSRINGFASVAKYKVAVEMTKRLGYYGKNPFLKLPIKQPILNAMGGQGAYGVSVGWNSTYDAAIANGFSTEEAQKLAMIGAKDMGLLFLYTAPIAPLQKFQQGLTSFMVKQGAWKQLVTDYGKLGLNKARQNFAVNINKALVNLRKNGVIFGIEGGREVIQENIQQQGEYKWVNKKLNKEAPFSFLKDTMNFQDVVNVTGLSFFVGGLAGNIRTQGRAMTADVQFQALFRAGQNKTQTEKQLAVLVENGNLTQDQADQLLIDARAVVKQVSHIPINATNQVEYAKALQVLEDLENNKKKLAPAFHKGIDIQIAEAKANLDTLIEESILEEVDIIGKYAKKPVEVYKSKEEFLIANPEASPYLLKSFEESDAFITEDDRIIINLDQAVKVRAVTVGSHELLHQIVGNEFSDKVKAKRLVQEFKDVLKTEGFLDIVQKRIDINYRYETFNTKEALEKAKQSKDRPDLTEERILNEEIQKDGKVKVEFKEETYAEEYLTAFSDAIGLGEIQFNEETFFGMASFFENLLKSVGFKNIKFSDGRQVYDFIKDYQKTIQSQKGKKTTKPKTKTSVSPTTKETVAKAASKTQTRTLQELTTSWQQGAGDVDVETDILPQLEAATISSLKRWGITRPKPLTFDLSNPEVVKEIKQEVGKELWSFIENFDETKSAATTYTDNLAKRIGPRLVKILARPKGQKDVTPQELENIAEEDTQETDDKEFKKRKYPSDIAAIEKQTANVRPEILTNIKNSIKQFMASAVGKKRKIGEKGKTAITKLDPSSLAKELKAQNKATKTAVVAAIGKGKQYKDFVTKVINDGYIETIPIAAMKKRFKTVKGFNIEKIGRETLGAGTGIYKLSGLNKQALIDFYTKDQSGRRSFIDLLAKGLTIEQFQEVKIDTEFMNDLAFKLKEAKSELTADEFMNEVERIYDGRTREKRSLDVVKASRSKRYTIALDPSFKSGKARNIAIFDEFAKNNGNLRIIFDGQEINPSELRVNNPIHRKYVQNWIENESWKYIPIEALSSSTLVSYVSNKTVNWFTSNERKKIIKKAEKNLKAYEKINGPIFTADEIKAVRLAQSMANFEKEGALNPDFYKGEKFNTLEEDHWKGTQILLQGFANAISNTPNASLAIAGIFNTQATASGHFVRSLAIALGFTEDFKKALGAKMEIDPIMKELRASDAFGAFKGKKFYEPLKTTKEHVDPSNLVGSLMLEAVLNNEVEFIMPFIKKIYYQIGITETQDNKLADNSAQYGDIYTYKDSQTKEFIESLIKGLKEGDADLVLNPLVRYLNPLVNNNRTGGKPGINTNKVWIKGKTVAETLTYKLPLKNQNASTLHYQNELSYLVLINKMTQQQAVSRLKKALPVNLAKTARAELQAEYNKVLIKASRTQTQKRTMLNSLETRIKAQSLTKPKKGISVFDFDDTLAKTKEKVIVYAPYYGPGKMTETRMELTPAEFAVEADRLERIGVSFDFSQFENVKNAKKGPLADLALKRQGKFGSGDIFVLTARPQSSATAIQTFLKGIGLDISLKNIVGLENGTPQAKAQWVLSKTAEGYNDFYFADDSKLNVDAVKQILDQVDIKSDTQIVKASKSIKLDKEFNKIVEETTGLKAEAKYSPVRARLEGRKKDKGFFKWFGRQLTITPSAEDFMGLMYDLMGSGKQGNRHAKWIRDNLIDLYNKAEQTILSAKVTVANDFAALKKAFPSLRSSIKGNPLMDQIGVGPYTKSQAMRVYIWNKQGMEIPGLSKRDQNALVAAVEADSELNVFADEIVLIQKDKQYPAPTDNWAGGTIDSDIMSSIDKTFRRQVMTEFDENTKIIFSDKNMNKLEALYGKKWVEALQDSLRRMKSGSNRPVYQGGGARIVNEMLDWLNGSVGAVMFLNVKSGLLQLISNVNFINWGDNNIYQAAKAFASKEYWPTVMKLMNSDYLVNRRDGLKINVNEAELANAAKDGGMKGAIAYLLDKGFIITRIMDSLAIATGGATFYINRRNALLKRQNPDTGKKYTQVEAETKTFDDFYAISEKTQQSSNPSKISQQQASLFGRVILAFQNVTMQYNRETKKSIRDLYNRRKSPGQTQRESDLGNLSKIIYYTTIQNIIFNGLQQALFAALFDDEEDKKEKNKTAAVANGMLDSLLFGLGFGGAAISTVKNVLLKVMEESDKKSPDYEEAVWEIFNISPVLDSKVRKLRTTAKSFSWNMEEIKKRGWSLDNPAYLAISQLISATTNIPIDRVLRKMMNIRMAMDEETRTWQRVALMLGWSPWSLGLPYWGLQSTIDQEEKEKEKIKASYKSDIRKMKASGYKKVMARVLKDYDPKDIIELRSPAGTVVYYAKAGKGKQAKN
jgi:hypothetical protein